MVINTLNFGQFWSVSCIITHCFGVPELLPRLTNPETHVRVGHQHSLFWPTLARFVDYYSLFWGPGVISMIDQSRGAITCGHQHSQFRPNLVRFVNYYSPFWDRKAISIVIEPQGALTCWSSAVTVLADSGPFCRLLLTFLGSQSDFHD